MEIEKIVTTKYKVDGVLFDTYEQAKFYRQYIKKENIVKMYNDTQEIKDTKGAIFLYLQGKESAQIFIEHAKSENSSYKGIEQGSEGFYYWDSSNEEYRNLKLDTLENAYDIFITYIIRLL